MIKLFIQDDIVNFSKFIFREQFFFTVVYYLVYEQVISLLYSYLICLIVVWIGCDVNDICMIFYIYVLIGEILVFCFGKEIILLCIGWIVFDEEKIELINQTVICYIDLIL